MDGDLRFLSHHDCMRAVERLAVRGRLPLRYSQGFNPRPILSVVFPRPVGVAARQDLLVLSVDEPIRADDLLGRLNAHAPRGMRFERAKPLEGKGPRPLRARYEMELDPPRLCAVQQRIDELRRQPCWQVERMQTARRAKGPKARIIDVRPLVGELQLDGSTLRVVLVRRGDMWARPAEVLRLLGMDERADLARLVRTRIECEFPPPSSAPAPGSAQNEIPRRE